MARRILDRLTYANVVSSLALFLVLTGGTAIALSGSNTVYSDDIVNFTVKGADVDEGSLAEVPKAAKAFQLGNSSETVLEEYTFPRVSIPVLIPPGGFDKTLISDDMKPNHFQAGFTCPGDPTTTNGTFTFQNTQLFNPDGNQAYNVWVERHNAGDLQFRRLTPNQQFSMPVAPLDVITFTYDDLRSQGSGATLTGAYGIAKFVVRGTSNGCIVRLHHHHYK